MEYYLNGQKEAMTPGLSLLEILAQKDLNPDTVVVELNREVIKKENYEAITIKEQDHLEVLRFVGGG